MASTSTRFCLFQLFAIAIIYQTNSQSITCDGNCSCGTSATPKPCTLNCDGEDQCKDSTLRCRVGDPCIINCIGTNSCSGDSIIDARGATNVSINCQGIDACKGNTIIDCDNAIHCDTKCTGDSACEETDLKCGNSQCSIDCQAGSTNTCKDLVVNTDNAVSFNCYNDCPHHLTGNPSITPTKSPIKTPTRSPSKRPSLSPIPAPTSIPTSAPTEYHTPAPTKNPLPSSTSASTQLPTLTSLSTSRTTVTLTTSVPTRTSITANPSITSTRSPTQSHTTNPTILPTRDPSSITYTTVPTKYPATAYPTISSSVNPTKLPSVIPSVLSTKESILTTTVSDGITSTETSVQESNEKDTSDVALGMPLWMIAVVGFGIVCCLLIVFMLCISKEKKKSYVNFESPDVNENDQQIVVRTDTRETHSVTSTKAEFNMGDLGASNSNLCEKTLNTFERGLMNNCVASDMLMDDIIDNMDTIGNIEMSNNNKIEVIQGELIDIQDSIDDINNNVNDEHVMLQEIIKMANDTRATAEGDNNNI